MLDDQYLSGLANAIADGSGVDWMDAESRAQTSEQQALVARYRAIAKLAAFHRTTGAGSDASDAETHAETIRRPYDAPVSLENGRFLIQRQLGRGGFGVVYEAYDRDRKLHLAIKSLHQTDISGIYELKKEFRALADLSHPNLVVLYDLFGDADRWFIAMELVKGKDFLSYVRARPRDDTTPEITAGRPQVACDLKRLEQALSQLARALCYLHGHRKLHRDIKPSNVMVTESGQVKLLDFGLATDANLDPAGDTVRVRGTPAYVAPEQAAGGIATDASDWYSVGVMLFEALTGQRPFRGSVSQILDAKRYQDPPAPSALCSGVPEGLDALCRDLLNRHPLGRPVDMDVATRLQRVWPASSEAGEVRLRARETTRFVGRTRQLEALHHAFDMSLAGSTQAAYVHGDSGMGKTALVRRFLEQLRERHPGVVVLEGRCYERESVPYKALDSLVDRLTRYLRNLPRAEADALLPRDVWALTRLFPVLRRVDAVAEVRHRVPSVADAQEQRRRGFAAFRELLARLSDRHPVALVVDDLQWGDTDSAELIADLLRNEDPLPLLFVACYRTEEILSNPALKTLVMPNSDSAAASSVGVHHVIVDQLGEEEAQELASVLCRTHGARAPASAIVRESGRSPFFITELVQYSAAADGGGGLALNESSAPAGALSDVTLETVIRARVARLAEGARHLLEVLGVFGRPLRLSIAAEVAELGAATLEHVMALRSAHLTRTRIGSRGDELELYHDRIREALVVQIPAERRQRLHLRLASVLERAGDADPETLVLHFHAAGESQQASLCAVLAADRAREALAFDRAARRYRLALDYGRFDPAKRREIQIKLGDALAAGGRGHAAAQAYLSAAEGALAADRLELKRRAAEQLLRSGHIDEGLSVLNEVLAVLHMKLPASPPRALLSLLLRRMWIRLRGLRFRERDRSQVSAAELVRVDACWSVATVIGVVDTIRGADYQARHLSLALKTGEPYRVGRALAVEIAYTALGGSRAGARQRARQQQLIAIAEALATRVAQPETFARLQLVKGTAAFFQGDWRQAHDVLERAEPMLRECAGVTWELDTAHLYHLLALFYLGEVRELSARIPLFLKEARERDDRTAATNLRTRASYIMHLAADQPTHALDDVREGMAGWTSHGYHAQHSWELYARGEIDLYCGNGPDAWKRIQEHWTPLRRSLLLRIQAVRIESLYLRARSAVAAARIAEAASEVRALLASAQRDAARLMRERSGWGAALAALVLSGTASLTGDRESAITQLQAAEGAFQDLSMHLHRAVSLRRRGELVGGSQGAELVRRADEWVAAQGIRNSARMADMLAPGNFAER
jgi:hypothetical protein